MSSPRVDLGSEQLGAMLWSEVTVEQKLNSHWTCRIVLRDTSDRRPEVEDYSGQPLRVTTFSLDGSENVIFSGIVHHMRLVYEVSGAYGAVLEAVSLSWKLDQGPRHAYFKQQTAHGTASKVLASSGLSVAGAMPAGATLSYVQWEETDFHFFARLVDDCEAWFRPAVDGSAALEAQIAFQLGPTVEWREGEYGLLEWTTRGQLGPIAAEGAHYDYQPMGSAVETGITAEPTFFGSAAERMVAAVRAGAPQLGSAWADRHRSATLADHTARLERESRRGLASAVTCLGISREPRVRAGDTVTVAGLPGVDAVYGVLEVTHRWTPRGYENRFTATPASRWSPAERPARPSLDGLYPARVVANHDPHNQGRIRVSYYWQEGGETSWVRLLAPHAGPGRGFLFLPELGDEVLICFEEGDPERPYAVGSAWNGVHQPPTSGFHAPGEHNQSEFAPNNVKRLVTRSGHRITMVDTPGKETVSIATPQHNRLMLTEHHADTGRPAIVLATAGDLILSAPNGRIHSRSATHSREVGLAAPRELQTPVPFADKQSPTHASGVGGFLEGLYDSTLKPVGHMVMHPIETAEGIGSAVAHPVRTAGALATTAKKTAQEVGSGNTYAIGAAIGTLGTLAIPGAGEASVAEDAVKLGKLGELGADAGKAGEIGANVEKATDAGELGADTSKNVGNTRSLETTGESTAARTGPFTKEPESLEQAEVAKSESPNGPSALPSTSSDLVLAARERQSAMLRDNTGYNISPSSWDEYPTIGRSGTYVSDQQGTMKYFGDLKGANETTIPSSTASQIESEIGLSPGSLQDGFKVRQVEKLTDIAPRSPLEGNEYFEGAGNHLPGGAPEMVINSIPTLDNNFVKTILSVKVVP